MTEMAKDFYQSRIQEWSCWCIIADKIYETISRIQAKLNRARKLWNLPLDNFWPLVPIFYLRKEDWVLVSVLNLKSFGNSWGNSCTMFVVLDIWYHFTCGEWKLYLNLQVFHNVMSVIVAQLFPKLWKVLNFKVLTSTV